MIKKVLIAEDHETANISVQKTLDELSIEQIEYVHYCDDAFTKINIALKAGNSYDLLITDLYFEEDYLKQTLANGSALIVAARQVQPDLKVLVFSSENKPEVIKNLYDKLEIDGYVMKARHDATELKKAMTTIASNQRHIPMHIMQLIKQKNAHDFTKYDLTIIELISQGMPLKDIPEHLQKNEIKPSGMSSIEKRLKLIREKFEYSRNEQLVVHCKSLGFI